VLTESSFKARSSKSSEKQQAYRAIYRMFKASSFDISPFAETLNSSNPQFAFFD
jgi:hypothetical protein